MDEWKDIAERQAPAAADSWRSLWPAVAKKWWVIVSGAVAGLIWLAQAITGWVGPPPWALWAIFSCALFVAAFGAYHDFSREAVDADNRRVRTINALGTRLWREFESPDARLGRFRAGLDELTDEAEAMIQDGAFYAAEGRNRANRWLDSLELFLRAKLSTATHDSALGELHTKLGTAMICSHDGAYDYTQQVAAAVEVVSSIRESTASSSLRDARAAPRRDLRAFKDWGLPE